MRGKAAEVCENAAPEGRRVKKRMPREGEGKDSECSRGGGWNDCLQRGAREKRGNGNGELAEEESY